MPVPTTISDLSTTAASNYPAGSDSPAILDDVQRAHASFIAQLRDGAHVPSATGKTTPVDADLIPINDSAASNIIKKLTWANLKATLKTYFDTLYAATGAFAAAGANSDITSLSALTNGIVGTSGNQTIAGVKTFSTQPILPQAPVLGTAVATTSGTSIDFTGIPSWVNKIVATWAGGSTNGASNVVWRVGTSGGIVATGYYGASVLNISGATSTGVALSTGIEVPSSSGAADVWQMVLVATRNTGNTWSFSLTYALNGTARSGSATGSIALGGDLDRIRLTAVNGTDAFDAGSINILYE